MVNEIFYLVTQIFLKLSLGIFFLRVFVQKMPRRIIKATMVRKFKHDEFGCLP
jgi:ABC-type glycerol-3-phosphate transport system permease component